MRQGVRIGVDVGTVRVGVAASDPAGTMASPVTVLRRDATTATAAADLAELAALVRDRGAIEVVVGHPRTLRGEEGPAALAARAYATALARGVDVPVRLVDERLTTVSATRALRASGRDARASRAVVDAAAAVVLLDAALDEERNTGRPPGQAVSS
jgi:putative Holliday junction resolvase